MPRQPIQTLQVRLRKTIALTLQEMWVLSRPYENHLTLELFASQLLEGVVAQHRSAKYTPRVKPFAPPAHYSPR